MFLFLKINVLPKQPYITIHGAAYNVGHSRLLLVTLFTRIFLFRQLTPKRLWVPYMEFRDFGHTTIIPICNWIFETFLVDGKFKGLSNKPPHARFWHFLQKLWCFLFFLSNEVMLSTIAIAAESAQNCLKLPNFVKIC
jgi:hypothetical protein